MIEIGKYNTLTILRKTSVGFFLGDDSGEDVLLPNKYCPQGAAVGEALEVFVYRDHEERKVATTLEPLIQLDAFALLQVSDVTEVGAFMDWGLEKDLLVPFREQRQKLEVGRWYLIYLFLDKETDRLVGSNKLEKFLSNDPLTVNVGDKVNILVMRKTEIGYNLIINMRHEGLIFHSDIFRELHVGYELEGYVKTIREDKKIDISLSPTGYARFNDVHMELIWQELEKSDGKLPLADKSSPEEIYDRLGMSKKAFKKAIGALYKAKKIRIGQDFIEIL